MRNWNFNENISGIKTLFVIDKKGDSMIMPMAFVSFLGSISTTSVNEGIGVDGM